MLRFFSVGILKSGGCHNMADLLWSRQETHDDGKADCSNRVPGTGNNRLLKGKKNSFYFSPSAFSAEAPVPKGRLAREQCTNIFHFKVLHGAGACRRKWKPKEVVKPGHFYARFDEEWKAMENVIGQRVWAKCSKQEARPVHSDSCRASSIFRDKDASLFQAREGLAHLRVLGLALGEGVGTESQESVSRLSAAGLAREGAGSGEWPSAVIGWLLAATG